jgi:hypothetical protein
MQVPSIQSSIVFSEIINTTMCKLLHLPVDRHVLHIFLGNQISLTRKSSDRGFNVVDVS